MKIAIVVQGRFHAFDLARALLDRGHDVIVLTNYPKWAVKRFGIAPERVRSFWVHGIVSRLAYGAPHRPLTFEPERWLHPAFGRWAAAELQKEQWDVVHLWTGVAEEVLKSLNDRIGLKLLMRGSAHIQTQLRILQDEERRVGRRMDRPSPWIVAREEREYELTDHIVVLSTFACDSFVAEGVDRAKLCLLPLGTRTEAFRPQPDIVEARCNRILSGQPLGVLYVGALSFQKGMWDMGAILRNLGGDAFRFRFVGPLIRELKHMRSELQRRAELVPKQPHQNLPDWYASSDLFVFPTIQDGFAVVLAQANAGALPVLTTPNCCGPDLIEDGKNGWVIPIRSPEAFVDRLRWCDSHRAELAGMVRHIYYEFQPRDWNDVAADFQAICEERFSSKTSRDVEVHGH